jgi:hypothetical protein
LIEPALAGAAARGIRETALAMPGTGPYILCSK